MFNPKRALLYAFLLAVLLEPILGRKGFSSGGHSYPKSGGLSGGGHRSGGLSGGGHSYPSSGASHSGSHGYPSSGLSGSGSSSGAHKYPSSGGSHGYPSSGGTHGYPPAGGSHGYPAGSSLSGSGSPSQGNKYPSPSGTHTYPSSGGSHTYPSSGGSHNYPSSGGGLSGNRQPSKPVVHHTTHVHNYHYAPPQRISYTPVHGGAPVYYPVYHSQPPTYVYQYRDSGSKYGTLLAGLALLNLGTLAVAATAHSGHSGSGSQTTYKPQQGEVCKFAVKRDNGDYDETKIDCQIISSFILQDQAQPRTTGTNTTTVVTVTNTTVTNNMMPQQPQVTGSPVPGNVMYTMLPNGTLVPVNMTGVPSFPSSPINMTQNAGVMGPNGAITSVTTTTTNTTLVNALDVKGAPVQVTPGMQCFVIRTSPVHNMRKNVPCGLLQTYADKSLQRKNSAARNVPMFTAVAAILAFCLAY